jgi:hypothetical protein
MEEILPFLIAIGYFIFQAFNASKKRAAKRAKKQQQQAPPAHYEEAPEPEQEPESIVMEDFYREFERAARAPGTVLVGEPEDIDEFEEDELTDEHKGHEDTLEPMHYEVPEEGEPQLSAEDEAQRIAFMIDDGEQREGADIDLRQAMVYDAILNRPKY